ncbi:MAG TPA: cytochrome P460 family protein [Candidatus Kapabacteria bacterium]|nr:cytochrome P460 family protein [Candidatus Kapabacteria bacterium]
MKNLLLVVAAVLGISGCSSGTRSTGSGPEYVANVHDFDNLSKWTQTVAPRHGADPSGMIGMAHMADNAMATRTIYVNHGDVKRGENGQFPTGTIFAKEISVGGKPMMVTGMVKRGGSFSKKGNGWEYFTLMNGMVTARGDTVMNGMCMGCHSQAGPAQDFVFTK